MRFLDPNRAVDLPALYEQAYVAGRKGEVLALLREILPAVDDFTYLPSGVHISYAGRGAVPAGVEGEGVLAFLRLALELAGPSEGLVLLEEPETFQHPASLVRSARAMIAAVRRGMQLVLTTHSLELVDRLLDEAQAQGLPTDQLALFNLRLDAGKLLSSRFDGESVLDGRRILDQDLR